MSKRLVDKHGNTVEPAIINGRAVFIPRAPTGQVLGRGMGDGQPDPTTPAHLAALGIDLASLRESSAMTAFNDRRPKSPLPKRRADINGHLLNEHGHTHDGVGSSKPPNLPELQAIHDRLHDGSTFADHQHDSTHAEARR